MRYLMIVLFVLFLGSCTKSLAPRLEGTPILWYVQTLSFDGPMVKEERSTFTDYTFDVLFTHEDGNEKWIYGYFAGNSDTTFDNSSERSIWEAKFVPEKAGKWSYEYAFRQGKNIALAHRKELSHLDDLLHSGGGVLEIFPIQIKVESRNFRNCGWLQDVKKRYLKFAGTGESWLKTGAGSPENILAYSGFDGTYDTGGNNFPALGENQLHEFEPHLKDWREGDPIWGDGKGKAIIGLMNYYADVGVNNQYMVTMNYEGDGWDVFPYVDPKDPYVFDVSKLAQWQILFDHMDAKGIAKNILLTETENESYFEVMDGVEVGKDFADSRKLYYREMVARFGHNLGLVWNLGEEHGVVGNSGEDPYRQPTSLEQRRKFAQYIRELDPYGHAVVSHNWPDNEEATYGDLLGDPDFSGISLQAHHNYFDKAKEWTDRSAAAGRPWVMMVDEPLGWEYGAQPDAQVENHKRAIEGVLWPSLMGGASGVDWYFGWQNNAPTSDLSNEDQRSRHDLWVASAKVRKFWEDTFDLPSLSAERSGANIIMTGRDKAGQPITLTAKRSVPQIPEGEGHKPWEYELLSLELMQNGTVRVLDPMNPQ